MDEQIKAENIEKFNKKLASQTAEIISEIRTCLVN